MAPSRRTEGGSQVMSRIVDAASPFVLPPSITASMLSPKCLATSAAVEHSPAPDILALVAVMGDCRVLARAKATGWLETRMPMAPVPPVSRGGMREEA